MSQDLGKNQRWVVSFGYWSGTFAEGASRVIIPLYFIEQNISTLQIGLMFFVFEAFSLLTNILSGFLLNRIGYKKVFLTSLVLHTLASLTYLTLDSKLSTLLILWIVAVARASGEARAARRSLCKHVYRYMHVYLYIL